MEPAGRALPVTTPQETVAVSKTVSVATRGSSTKIPPFRAKSLKTVKEGLGSTTSGLSTPHRRLHRV
jgi:hypothetical protein